MEIKATVVEEISREICNGIRLVTGKKRLKSFINENGDLVSDFIYDELSDFSYGDGLSIAKKDKNYGVINKSNDIIINFNYDRISSINSVTYNYANGDFNSSKKAIFFACYKNEICTILDLTGQIIVENVECSYIIGCGKIDNFTLIYFKIKNDKDDYKLILNKCFL